MRLSKISILAAALSLSVVAACNRADETASTYGNEPATTEPATTPSDTTTPATAPSSTTAGTTTAPTDMSGSTGTGIEPATPTPPATTTADATTSFDDLDTNNDGSISQDELSTSSSMRQDFQTTDKDGNGTLSRAEYDAHHANTMPPAD